MYFAVGKSTVVLALMVVATADLFGMELIGKEFFNIPDTDLSLFFFSANNCKDLVALHNPIPSCAFSTVKNSMPPSTINFFFISKFSIAKF